MRTRCIGWIVAAAGLALAALMPETAAAAACDRESVGKAAPVGVTVDTAVPKPAAGLVPAHCEIAAHLSTSGIDGGPENRVGFLLELPDEGWNGKFLMAGGGGYDGGFSQFQGGVHGLSRHYATAATDGGHAGGDDAAWARGNETRVVDFGDRAVHLVRNAAVAMVTAISGEVRRSYFAGCSTGGRMALMEAQRHPADFDGIIAGAPAWDYDGLLMDFAWNEQALLRDRDHYIPATKLKAIGAAELAQCRASGGVEGGLIADPGRCRFDASLLQCKSGDADDCLTPGQVDTLQRIQAGPRTKAGHVLYPGLPVGTEDAGNWPAWVVGKQVPPVTTTSGGLDVSAPEAGLKQYGAAGWPLELFFANQYFKFLFFPPAEPVPEGGALAFDVERDPVRRFAQGATQDPTPDLREFQERGGKLILYGGWGDPVVPLPRTLDYLRTLATMTGGEAEMAGFARLFSVPGLTHCYGGAVPNSFGQPYLPAPPGDAAHDITTALDAWVRDGQVPASVIATQYEGNDVTKAIVRDRPLCVWPKIARLDGGDPDKAASYSCRE